MPGTVVKSNLSGLRFKINCRFFFIFRGRGTFCAFDCKTSAARDEMVEMLKREGIQTGGAGEFLTTPSRISSIVMVITCSHLPVQDR